MDHRSHPTFGAWFQAIFLRAWCLAFVCFIGGLLLLKNGFTGLGWTLVVAFGLTVVGTLAYLFHRIYHVACPSCDQEARTRKDLDQGCMVAICDRCKVVWALGIRLGTGQ